MHISDHLFIFQTGDGLHWRQIETIELVNSGSGLGFGIIGGRATGVIVKTILPGGAADLASILFLILHVYMCLVLPCTLSYSMHLGCSEFW